MSACWWSCIYYFLFSNFGRSLLVAISERFLVLSLCSIWRCVFCHWGTRAPGCCQRGFCEVCWCSPQHWEIRHSATKDHQTCKHRFNLCFESFIVLKVHTSVKNIHFKESFGKNSGFYSVCVYFILCSLNLSEWNLLCKMSVFQWMLEFKVSLVLQMLHDLNTYLNKAIPDTKLTIRKYLDVKFEYLVRPAVLSLRLLKFTVSL